MNQIRTIHYVNSITFTHIPKMNSVNISFNINKATLLKLIAFALNHDSHCKHSSHI